MKSIETHIMQSAPKPLFHLTLIIDPYPCGEHSWKLFVWIVIANDFKRHVKHSFQLVGFNNKRKISIFVQRLI